MRLLNLEGGLCGKCRLPGHARSSMRCTHNIRQLNQDYLGETNAWLAANPTILPTQYRTKHGFTKWSESWRRQNKKSLPFQRVDLQSETLTNICSPPPTPCTFSLVPPPNLYVFYAKYAPNAFSGLIGLNWTAEFDGLIKPVRPLLSSHIPYSTVHTPGSSRSFPTLPNPPAAISSASASSSAFLSFFSSLLSKVRSSS